MNTYEVTVSYTVKVQAETEQAAKNIGLITKPDTEYFTTVTLIEEEKPFTIRFLCHKCHNKFEVENKKCVTKRWTWHDMHSWDNMITYKTKCPKCNNSCEEDFVVKEN